MTQQSQDESAFVATVLRAYLDLPETPNRARPADRALARSLFHNHVPLSMIEAALLLASARRLVRPLTASPLNPVRSLHYFLPVIDELKANPPCPSYLDYLRRKIVGARDLSR